MSTLSLSVCPLCGLPVIDCDRLLWIPNMCLTNLSTFFDPQTEIIFSKGIPGFSHPERSLPNLPAPRSWQHREGQHGRPRRLRIISCRRLKRRHWSCALFGHSYSIFSAFISQNAGILHETKDTQERKFGSSFNLHAANLMAWFLCQDSLLQSLLHSQSISVCPITILFNNYQESVSCILSNVN